MITPSFNLTATERVLPKLALDFTTAVLDARVTFARTTGASNPATYVNSSGLVTAATNNQPRFDFNPVTLVCRGLLIEEQRANLLTYSAQFENPVWVKTAVSVSADAATAPDGTLTADKLIADSTTGQHRINISPTSSAGAQTLSVYAKAGEYGFAYIRIGTTGALFNLSTGAYISSLGSPTSYSSTDAGNGWYRLTVTVTALANDIARINVQSNATTNDFAGNGVNGIFIWGAQLETGAFATSYIPTTTAALTRNADVATMTGTNFSSWYNQSEGTFETQFTSIGFTTNGMLFSSTPGNLTATIQAYWTASTTITSDGGASASMTISGAQNTASNFVYAYKLNNYAMSINAATPSTDLSGTPPSTLSQLNLGHRNGSLIGSQHIRKFMYWPQRLTNAEVQSFSK